MSEKEPNQLRDYTIDNNILTCVSENGVILKAEILTDHIIRVRYSTNNYQLPDFSYALNPNFKQDEKTYTFKDAKNYVVIATERVECRIKKQNLQVSFYDNQGTLINEDEKGFHWEVSESTGNDIVQMSKQVQKDEVFFGLGDKPTEMNIKNKRFENWGSDCYGYSYNDDPLYKNIPFYYGLHHGIGYGIFFDNSFRTFFDFGHERPDATSFWSHGGEMNYYFIAGPNLLEVSERYAALTGTADMPALWALGFQQCKWSYKPESQVREITSKMRELKIPCDAIYLDIDYMDGFRCFTWDKEHFPAPKKMISDLSSQGFKTMVIIDPGIKKDPDYWVFKEGLENDYFCKYPDGPYVEGNVWPGACYFPDFTKPEVRSWWADLYEGLISHDGVAGVWNDMNEPAIFDVETKTFTENVMHDYDGHLCSHAKAHNVYGMQMARATYEGVKKHGDNKRALIITRSGYSGLQRYSSVWTGDNIATWQHIWIANVQCQRLAISGVSYAGSDIGGFIGQPTPEMFVRWIQLGIFHPFCRVHSSQDDGDQEPWSFGDKATDLFREAVELRYQMLPYHYTAFYQHHKFGTPILKPLTFIDQEDEENYYRDHEFLCGNNILSASIDEEKCKAKTIYLPQGKWYNYWDNELHDGRNETTISITENTFPFLIKAGSVIPFYPIQQYVGEKQIDVVTLKIYYSENSEISNLYVDALDGYEYESGDYRYSTFYFENFESNVVIKQSWEGTFKPHYQFKIELIGFENVKGIDVDGKKIDVNEVLAHDFRELTISK